MFYLLMYSQEAFLLVYKMETGNFMVSIPLTGKISRLRHVNREHSSFHLIRNYLRILVYGTNFRIIPFPKWKFCSAKMETLV